MIPVPLLLLGIGGLIWAALSRPGTTADPAAATSGGDIVGPPAYASPIVTESSPIGEPPIGPGMSAQDVIDAKTMAPDIESNLLAAGSSYDRVGMAAFQRKTRLTVDGLYGGRSAGALSYFLGRPAPAPLFAPLTPIAYTPVS